jgi:hypothetical protein
MGCGAPMAEVPMTICFPDGHEFLHSCQSLELPRSTQVPTQALPPPSIQYTIRWGVYVCVKTVI